MATLRLSNVPKIVIERLEELARREGISVDAMAVRQLAEATQRANDSIVLPDLPPPPPPPRDGAATDATSGTNRQR